MSFHFFRLFFCFFGLFVLLAQAKTEKLQVVATTTMVADLVRVVGGDNVELVGLMAPEVDPHSYQSKIKDAILLRKADVIFYSGLHLEGNMQSVFERMSRSGRYVYAVSDAIDKRKLLSPQVGFQKYFDPHIWGDPNLWKLCALGVADFLSKLDPVNARAYLERARVYEKDLEALFLWAKKRIALIPFEKRILITSHDAFFYFGSAFGFVVRGLQGTSTISEVGLRDRAELVRFIRQKKIPTLFAETSVNAKGIIQVAKEANVALSDWHLFSDAMARPNTLETFEGETYDTGTYLGMMKHNINAIVRGLSR